MAGIPESAHYREAETPDVSCASCLQYDSGYCRMFQTDVGPTMVCDEWEQIVSDHAAAPLVAAAPLAPGVRRVPVEELVRLLQLGYRRAEDLEPRLARILQPILEAAGMEAAREFERRATDHLTAALRTGADVQPTSAMVALYPTAEQARALAEAGAEAPELMHVTLCYLGKDSSVEACERFAAALGPVAATHPPLAGVVGGLGVFDDHGQGHPAIVLPDVPGLIELRQAVCEAVLAAGGDYPRDHGYMPHLTVAYRDDGPTTPAPDAFGAPLSFGSLHVVLGNETVAEIPLTGTPAVTAAAHAGVDEQIAAVAEKHEPEGGYGQTWWREVEGEIHVYWVCADWTDGDEIEAATADFYAIEGVEDVEVCDECGDPGEGWTKAWPRTLTAAGNPLPGWTPPAGDEILDVPALVSKLRTKTDPVRMAVVETMMTPALNGAGLAFDTTNPLTAKVLAQSGSQVTNIAATTQLNVMRVINASYNEGLTIPDTAKAIRAGMKEASTARATLIARTELVGAVNGGSLAATQLVGEATETAYFKQWLTSPGAMYPRHEDYEGLDGQTVHLDDYFDVGGDMLQHPGDPDGSPEEVCNCRCTMTYTDDPAELSDGGGGGGGGGGEAVAVAEGGEEISMDTEWSPPPGGRLALKESAPEESTYADWRALKGSTQKQVENKMQTVVDDFSEFYGLPKAAEARFEPEATAAWDTDARTLVAPSSGESEVWYGQGIMDKARDPEMGLFPYRQIAHEAAHTINSAGTHGFAHEFEEGGAEILSLRYWAERGQPFDARDAVRVDGKWTAPGLDSLAHSVVYRDYVTDVMRRSASRVGWNRDRITADVLQMMKGDHGERLRWRDATNPRFRLPEGVRSDAPDLMKWFLNPEWKVEVADTYVPARYSDPLELPSTLTRMERERMDPGLGYRGIYDTASYQADPVLFDIAKDQGFGGLPHVVSEAELQAYVDAGEMEVWRGVEAGPAGAKEYAEQIQSGEYFAGVGVHGNGTYSAMAVREDTFAVTHYDSGWATATSYASNRGAVVRMTLNADARVIREDDLQDLYYEAKAAIDKERDKVADELFSNEMAADKSVAALERAAALRRDLEAAESRRRAHLQVVNDSGRFAAALGYDAIIVPGREFVVVLNRTALRVSRDIRTANENGHWVDGGNVG